MSEIRLFIDEDSAEKAIITAFRKADLDVVTVADVNRLSYSDSEQLIWATQQKRVLYSYNVRDFCQLHHERLAASQSHAGIILVPQQRYSVGQLLKGLIMLREQMSAEEIVDQLIFLSAYI